jgi:biopolymer transport protein TolR
VPKGTYLIAALFVLLAGIVAMFPDTPRGLPVRIARVQPCGEDDRRVVVVSVLPRGVIRINQEDVSRTDLNRRLEELFKTRVYRWVLVAGDPSLQFREVADIIDDVSKKVDYISILTPAVLKQADWRTATCLDPNLPHDYFANPPR